LKEESKRKCSEIFLIKKKKCEQNFSFLSTQNRVLSRAKNKTLREERNVAEDLCNLDNYLSVNILERIFDREKVFFSFAFFRRTEMTSEFFII
jgi:hypothetical protein